MRLSRAILVSLATVVASPVQLHAQPATSPTSGAEAPSTREAAGQAYGQGKSAYQAGDYARAYQHFKRANDIIPTPNTLYWMAVCLDQQGKRVEARQAYGRVLARPDLDKLGEDAVDNARARHQALGGGGASSDQSTPSSPDAQRAVAAESFNAGRAAYEVGDYETAYQHFKRANDIIPTPHAQYWIATCLDQLDRKELALDAYGTLLFDPDVDKVGEQRLAHAKARYRDLHAGLDTAVSESGSPSDAGDAGRARIRFRNQLTGAVRVEQLRVLIDGTLHYDGSRAADRDGPKTGAEVFSGSLPVGNHILEVVVLLRGSGYGLFSYMEGYRFTMVSAHLFTVIKDQPLDITLEAWERNPVTTPLERRLALRYAARSVSEQEFLNAGRPRTIGLVRDGWAWHL